jgi:hypothetical protein
MKVVRVFVLVAVALLVAASLGMSKPEFAKREGQKCTVCHPAGKFKELTDAGKYYAEHKTLEGYKAAEKK